MIAADKNVPQGNGEMLGVDGDVIRFAAEKCGSPLSMWFGFRILGAQGRQVTCVWERTNEVLGSGHLAAVSPVYRPLGAGSFRRVPTETCSFDKPKNQFTFQVPCESDEVHVYYCHPYGPAELDSFLRCIEPSGCVRVTKLVDSEGGRPCKLVTLSDGRPGKRQVWTVARSHSGEVSGSFTMEGMVQGILADKDAPSKADFHFVPFVDTDGVWQGWYGKDRVPRDFNRDYCLEPVRPETRSMLSAMGEKGDAALLCEAPFGPYRQKSCVPFFMFDLHAPTPGDPGFLVPPKLSLIRPDDWLTHCRFAATLDELSPEGCPVTFREFLGHGMTGSLSWAEPTNYDMTCSTYFYLAYGATAFTLEVPYHRSLGLTGKVLEPDDWRELGRRLAKAILRALDGDLKSLDKAPDRPIPLLSQWHLTRTLRDATVSEDGASLDVTGTSETSRVWVALNQPFEDAASLGYRLEGTLKDCKAVLREVRGPKSLPTGRLATSVLNLSAGEGRLSIPPQGLQSFRVVLCVDGVQ
ncbi:MAG: hypothetical protein FJ278_14205, partial [Planctomycetes bacterium]|nr:hypothetical protein [Planctomycetota bacterium]